MAPTDEGERFIPIAERLIRDFDTAIFDLNATADRRSGHLSIAVVPSVATRLFPEILKSFSEQYPGISVHMIDDNSRGVQQRLIRNEVDFGIGSRLRARPDLEFRPLFEDRVELICHQNHPLAKHKGSVRWSDLRAHDFLDSGLHGIVPVPDLTDNPKFRFSTTTTLFAMVKANIGVTVLPSLATRSGDPELVTKPMIDPVVKREIFLVTRKEWSLSHASEAMIEVLAQEMPENIARLDAGEIRSKIRKTDFPALT